MPPEIVKSGDSRIWLLENGFGPNNAPEYQGCMKLGDTQWGFGDITRVECPSPDRYDAFVEVAEIPGETERPTFSLMGRYPRDLSDILALARKGCAFGIIAAFGSCRDPQDLQSGWDKVRMYPRARITQWADENAGAIDSSERNPTNETAELSARELYEVVPLSVAEILAASVTREIYDVVVCDGVECGDCGEPSSGCSKVFGLQAGVGSTPGILPSVVVSDDGGLTGFLRNITTLFSNEVPASGACVAGNLVIVSPTGGMHYADLEDLLNQAETWIEASTGLVMSIGGPSAIFSTDASHTWVVGEGGYVYFTANPTNGVSVQSAGTVTAQGLNAIHGASAKHLIAVGDSNVVLLTSNGGDTWELVTGPSAAVNLTACWMISPSTWLVGNASGGFYFTLNAGDTWTAISLPVAAVAINDIQFVDEAVGYLAVDIAGTVGVVLRTITGGNTWYTLPESSSAAALPDNDSVNALAVCKSDPNVVFGGGLGAGASDGFMFKGSGGS